MKQIHPITQSSSLSSERLGSLEKPLNVASAPQRGVIPIHDGVRAGGEAFFVQLWLRLERTRRLLGAQHKRFCIRNVLKAWFGHEANDDFIWEVCHQAIVDDEPQEGWNELPAPMLYPRRHREFLRAIVAVKLGISFYRVSLKALDKAYSIAFPNSTPININKKASRL